MKKYLIMSLILFTPTATNAAIIFTEIMYNPEGTDSGREWVEVYNDGTESVDLSTHKLFENESNHRISAYDEGDVVLESNQYAILADSPEKFLLDYDPPTESIILDSAFSLRNDGEEFQLYDAEGNLVIGADYVPEWGANGTGNSLQLASDGTGWIPAVPTPGKDSATSPVDESDDEDGDTGSGDGAEDSNSSHKNQVKLSDFEPKIDLEIGVGRERYVLINTPIRFELQHNQGDSDVLVEWSFGDGYSKRGEVARHEYNEEGVYNLVANVELRDSDEKAVSRTKIHVLRPDITVSMQKSGKHVDFLLINNSNQEMNIGGFVIKTDDQKFRIADDTIIDGGSRLTLSHYITNIVYSREIKILYPNERTLFKYRIPDMYYRAFEFVPEDRVGNFWKVVEKVYPTP